MPCQNFCRAFSFGDNMKIFKTFPSPVGNLSIAAEDDHITNIVFDTSVPNACKGDSPVLHTAISQLNEYFAGVRKSFDLPLKFSGTEFQKQVWHELSKIPYGETVSYKELAERVGNIKACRAVGMANNKNPIPIIIPCHRVIGANGKLTGYAGGLNVKKFLLDLENK